MKAERRRRGRTNEGLYGIRSVRDQCPAVQATDGFKVLAGCKKLPHFVESEKRYRCFKDEENALGKAKQATQGSGALATTRAALEVVMQRTIPTLLSQTGLGTYKEFGWGRGRAEKKTCL